MDLISGKLFKGDRVVWIVLMLLSLLSLLIVYSSTGALAYRVASGNTLHYLIRQIFFLGMGFGIILLMVNVFPVKLYSIIANYLLYASIGLLALAVVMRFAGMLGGSGRTLNLGIISFQPAELGKNFTDTLFCQSIGKKTKNKTGSCFSI